MKTFSQPRSPLCRFIGIVVALLMASSTAAWADDAEFLDGLRARRLFRLAEIHCRERLDDPATTEPERADWTIELIRTLAAHAANARPDERDALWQAAEDAAADFQRQLPNHPRLLLVRMQDALTELARGELARQEAEVLPDGAAALQQARDTIRQAARSLEQLQKDIAREIPLRIRERGDDDTLTADELRSLGHHVNLHLGRVYRNQALCYPAGSSDRVAALAGAIEHLKQPLTQVDAADPLAAKIRLEHATCLRLLGNYPAASAELESLVATGAGSSSHISAELKLHAQAELVRVRLDQGRAEEALRLLQQAEQSTTAKSPEWDFAHLETVLAMWRTAEHSSDRAAAERWRNSAVELVKRIEQTHGAYWGRRGDLLLVSVAGGSATGGGDWEILSRSADNLYRKGQFDEAIAAYESAGDAAVAAGHSDTAFELRYKAALVEHTRKRHRPAAERFRRLATESPDHSKAAETHLLAVWNAAQQTRAEPDFVSTYATMLEEHLSLWPENVTTATACQWLGKLRESQADWSGAVEAYLAAPRSEPQFPEAVEAAARCSRLALRTENFTSDDAEKLAAKFVSKLTSANDSPPEHWTPANRELAIAAARIYLQPSTSPDGFARAESILRSALGGQPPPDGAWQSLARSLLAVALAGQPTRRAQARGLLTTLGAVEPSVLIETLRGLHRVNEVAEAAEIAELELLVIGRLEPQFANLSTTDQQFVRDVHAAALVATGKLDAAIEAYRELAEQKPNDGGVQQQYASLLLQSPRRDDWQTALDRWRTVRQRSRPHTDRWYQSNYSIALALEKLGNASAAAERIRYLQAVPPGIASEHWKPRFDELLRRLEQSGS